MTTDQIHDQGPEILGTRLTVHNLLPDFLDPNATEESICRIYDLKPEQVAAARAYILNHPDLVLGGHLQVEAKRRADNPPDVVQRASATHVALLNFKEWLARRQEDEVRGSTGEGGRVPSGNFPTFREWLAEQEAPTRQGS